MAKPITDHQRQQILALRNKRTGREIAKTVGVSTAIVSLVLNGKHQATTTKPTSKATPPAAEPSRKRRPARDAPPPPPPAVTAPAPESSPDRSVDKSESAPDVVPEGTSLEQIERWIKIAEEEMNAARGEGNATGVASLLAKLVSLAEHRRKATPVAKDDPNDNPDMIALGDQVWERLKKAMGE